jgi:hypothetical protein
MEHNYKYSFEEKANINITWEDIYTNYTSTNNNTNTNTNIYVVYILCYHIEKQSKYPFLQFMMNKIPTLDDVFNEQFILPYKLLRGNYDEHDIKTTMLAEIKNRLNNICCKGDSVTDEMYKGVIYGSDNVTPFVLINISDIDIYGLHLSVNTPTWFALTSEIINTRSICDIIIDPEITELFIHYPNIGLVTNLDTNTEYIIPDPVYTSDKFSSVEFKSVFGNLKTKAYNSCREFYYFYRTFEDVFKSNILKDKKNLKDNNLKDNKNLKNGINRYALFMEGKLYMEELNEFSLSDNIIDEFYNEPCIIICYMNLNKKLNPDILVKSNYSSVCISYHKIDKTCETKIL